MNESSTWLFATISTACGAVVTGFLTLWRDHRTDERLRSAITQAVVTEISAIMLLVKQRHYRESLQGLIQSGAKSSPDQSLSISIVFPENPFPVYSANVDKIGLIPDGIRKDVVIFYQLIQAAMCDVKSDGGTFTTGDVNAVRLQELISIFDRALDAGEFVEKWNQASWWQRLLLRLCPKNTASGSHL